MELDRQITIMTEKAKQVKRKTKFYHQIYNDISYKSVPHRHCKEIYITYMLYESVSHKQSQYISYLQSKQCYYHKYVLSRPEKMKKRICWNIV
jgi:hypothetical protein